MLADVDEAAATTAADELHERYGTETLVRRTDVSRPDESPARAVLTPHLRRALA